MWAYRPVMGRCGVDLGAVLVRCDVLDLKLGNALDVAPLLTGQDRRVAEVTICRQHYMELFDVAHLFPVACRGVTGE